MMTIHGRQSPGSTHPSILSTLTSSAPTRLRGGGEADRPIPRSALGDVVFVVYLTRRCCFSGPALKPRRHEKCHPALQPRMKAGVESQVNYRWSRYFSSCVLPRNAGVPVNRKVGRTAVRSAAGKASLKALREFQRAMLRADV